MRFDNDCTKTDTFFVEHWFGDMIVPRLGWKKVNHKL